MTGMTWEEYAAASDASLLTATAHSAPMALLFYQGENFPAKYSGDAEKVIRLSQPEGRPWRSG